MPKHNLIGGKFGFPKTFLEKSELPKFLEGDPIRLFNARSGIKLVVNQLRPHNVWLPSYLCPTIISAIDQNITHINFYPISETLSVVSKEFLVSLNPNDLFLCIDYFGYPFDRNILEQVKQCGCKIFRDCSQALFFDFQNDQLCEYHLFSPRKFLGVPDGGILHFKHRKDGVENQLPPPPYETFNLLFEALLLRREFDLYGGERNWTVLFDQSEEQFSPNLYKMSQLSDYLLRFGFDYEDIIVKRRSNYLLLAEKLRDLAIFPDLPINVTPLGFPIRYMLRTKLQKALFTKNIYPPIHWNIEGHVPEIYKESHKLSHQILTIPCDQRYSLEDMDLIAEEVLGIINGN